MAINKYSQPLGQTLEQYIPLPFEEMSRAASAIQQRGDLAEQQRDQVETGLSSMETMASGQTQFKNNFVNDYKKEGMELLKKYPNPSDPDFIRESRKLNMKYAADPRLQTIKQTNEFLKNQEKYKQEAAFKGIKVIDPNKNFTGVDNNGNLIVPKNSARGTNFDEDLTKSFLQIRDNMIDDGKGWKSNKQNLDQLAGNLVKNLETNPVTRDAIDYYTQQGMSPEQARQATKGLIQQAYTDNLKTDRDYQYDNLQINKAQLSLAQRRQAMDEMEFKAKMQAKQSQGLGLVPEQGPIDPVDLNKGLLNDVDKVLKNLNKSGGLSKDTFVVSDTPENRKKYAGKFRQQVSTIAGSGMGYGGSSYKELVVQGNYNKDYLEVLKAAREQVGEAATNGKGGYLKDKTVLEKYQQFLKNDNVSHTFWNTQSGDVMKQLDNVYVGSAGEKLGNASVVKDGKIVKVAKGEGSLKGYKGFSFSGISAVPMDGFPNGAIKVNAVDENGDVVQILKPLDIQTASYFQISNKGYKALTSGKTNATLAKDKSLYIGDGQGGVLVPQKVENGGVNLFYINPNTGERLNKQPLPFQEYVNEEHNNFNTYINQFSNKG